MVATRRTQSRQVVQSENRPQRATRKLSASDVAQLAAHGAKTSSQARKNFAAMQGSKHFKALSPEDRQAAKDQYKALTAGLRWN